PSAHRAGGPSTRWAGLSCPRTWHRHRARTSSRQKCPEWSSRPWLGLLWPNSKYPWVAGLTRKPAHGTHVLARQKPPARIVRRESPKRDLSEAGLLQYSVGARQLVRQDGVS